MNNFLIILLLCIVIVLYVFTNRENFANTCTILNSKKDIINKNKEFVRINKLESYLELILEPLFNQKIINNNLTVQEYLEENKIPKEHINLIIELYKNILELNEYNLDDKSLMNTLVNTMYVNNLKNSMTCVIADKKVLDMLIQQILVLINTPKVEICTKEKFIEYCNKNYSAQIQDSKIKSKVKITYESNPKGIAQIVNKQEIEKFANELEETRKEINTGTIKILDSETQMLPLIDNNSKFMNAKSITDIMNSFDEKSFGSDVEKQLNILIKKYQIKYGKKVNLIDIKEFGNLVRILIDEIKLIIRKLIDEDNINTLKIIIADFNLYRKIFYLFKHNYKIVQAYQIINKEISDNDEKLRSILCCSKIGTNSCHNFSNIAKNPKEIIFGFNNMGYVKNIKCIKNSDEAKKLEAEQERTLDDILSLRYDMWKKISKDEKMIIIDNFNKLLKINGVNIHNINGKLGDIRQEMSEQKKLEIEYLYRTLPIIPHDISNFFKLSKDFSFKIVQVMKLEKIKEIQDYINKEGFNKEQVIFNDNVNLDYAKKIIIGLMTAQEILSNFNYKDNTDVVAKIFGIMKTNQTFNEILENTPIQSKYHNIIIDYLMKNIKSGNYAVIEKYDMHSLPGNVIKYLQLILPDINLCRNRDDFLQKLRKDRMISVNEFKEYDKKLEILCNSNKK